MKNLKRIKAGCAVVACAWVVGLPASVHAQRAATTPATTSTSKAQPTKDAPSSTQQKAQPVKPAVALREPTREEVQKLLEGMAEYVNDSVKGLTVVEHPDGRLWLDHEGRFQNVTVAKMNPDGTISTECVTSIEQARQFLTKKKSAAPPAAANGKKPGSGGINKAKPSPANSTPAKLEEK